jgi:hypothetical protein
MKRGSFLADIRFMKLAYLVTSNSFRTLLLIPKKRSSLIGCFETLVQRASSLPFADSKNYFRFQVEFGISLAVCE